MNRPDKPISLQDIFDAAWQAFIVEGRPPAHDGYSCQYLTFDGRRCAVGLVLPDKPSPDELDGDFSSIVSEFPEWFDEEIQELNNTDPNQLNRFQQDLHDSLIANEDWTHPVNVRRDWYLKVAKSYNLKLPEGADDAKEEA